MIERARAAREVARRIPLTLLLLVAVTAAGLVTRQMSAEEWTSLMSRFGTNLDALRAGKPYLLWIGLLFASDAGLHITMLAMLACGVGALEYARGTITAAIAFLVLGPISSALTLLLLWPLDAAGVAAVHPFLNEPDMGSSSASLLCWGVFITGLGPVRSAALVVGTSAVLVALPLVMPGVSAVDHLVAFVFGVCAGLSLMRRRSRTGISPGPP